MCSSDLNIGGLRLEGVNGESFAANGVANSKNVWEASRFTSVTDITGNNGADSRNYDSLNLAGLTTNQATINPAAYTSLTGSKSYDGTTRFSNVRLQGVAGEFFTLDDATAEFSSIGVNNRFAAVTRAPRSTMYSVDNYQPLDLNDLQLINQAIINAAPARINAVPARRTATPGNLALPVLTPMGSVPNSIRGFAIPSGAVSASAAKDDQKASWIPGLQIIGSGIRLPERSATMLSDQDFE